jgi:hypothetical protein
MTRGKEKKRGDRILENEESREKTSVPIEYRGKSEKKKEVKSCLFYEQGIVQSLKFMFF